MRPKLGPVERFPRSRCSPFSRHTSHSQCSEGLLRDAIEWQTRNKVQQISNRTVLRYRRQKKVQQIGSIPKENAFPGSKSQRSVSCVNTFREFLTPGIPVHLMVTQATIWGFSGGQTQYFNPLQRRALVRLFWAKQQYLLA